MGGVTARQHWLLRDEEQVSSSRLKIVQFFCGQVTECKTDEDETPKTGTA